MYGSDKGSIKHGYTRTYERIVNSLTGDMPRREVNLSVCEFGVACGSSLRMWATYLPKSFITGFDIREECLQLCRDIPNVKIVISDPRSHIFESGCYDLIVEDSSHISEDIVDIFNNSWSALRPGGYYVIEDLACTYNEAYGHQFSKIFNRPVVNNRSTITDLIDNIMRLVDQRSEVASFEYHPQLMVLRKTESKK